MPPNRLKSESGHLETFPALSRMSAAGGQADVACQELSGPFLARFGHLVFRHLSFGRFRVVLDGTHRMRYRVANATEHQNAIDARDNTRRPVARDVA